MTALFFEFDDFDITFNQNFGNTLGYNDEAHTLLRASIGLLTASLLLATAARTQGLPESLFVFFRNLRTFDCRGRGRLESPHAAASQGCTSGHALHDIWCNYTCSCDCCGWETCVCMQTRPKKHSQEHCPTKARGSFFPSMPGSATANQIPNSCRSYQSCMCFRSFDR